MKKHQAILFLLLAVVLAATPAIAQRGGGGGGGGGKSGGKSSDKTGNKGQKIADTSNAELESLTSKLTLTDPQKAQVKSALDARDAQLVALKKEKLPKDQSKDKSTAIKDAANDKIRTLLTPTQQAIFDHTMKKGGKKNKEEAVATNPTATPAATSGSPTP